MFRKLEKTWYRFTPEFLVFPKKSIHTVWLTNMVDRQPEKEILEWCRAQNIMCESFGPEGALMQLDSTQRDNLPWAPEYHRISFRSIEEFVAFKISFIDGTVQIINPIANS